MRSFSNLPLVDLGRTQARMILKPFTLTAAQLRSGNTAPIVIVPGIAGRLLVGETFAWDIITLTAMSANPTWSFRYTTFAFDLSSTTTFSLNAINHQNGRISGFSAFNTTTDLRGQSLTLRSTADVTGGSIESYRGVIAYLVL